MYSEINLFLFLFFPLGYITLPFKKVSGPTFGHSYQIKFWQASQSPTPSYVQDVLCQSESNIKILHQKSFPL